jgi:hypothetical protein
MRFLPLGAFVAAVGLAGFLLPVCPTTALAQPSRSIQVGLSAGARSFASRLDLSSEFAGGVRVGLDLGRHASLLMDAVYTTPTRTTTNAFTRVISVRTLVQVRPLSGRLRPYAIGGLGGTLFDFEDTPDASGGTLTGGVGVEWDVRDRFALFGEGSIDWYRNRYVTYAPTGERLSISDRTTEQIRSFGAGLLARF